MFVSFEKSEDEKIFDKYGKYKGKFDDGRFFDPYGKYKGKIINEGSIYSPYGKFLGKIESSGKIYDPYGKYKGRIENFLNRSLEGSINNTMKITEYLVYTDAKGRDPDSHSPFKRI